MTPAQRPPRPVELLSRLLDRGYTNAARTVIESLNRDVNNGRLATALRQFDDHARELASNGERVAADDPVLRGLLAEFDSSLRRQAALIDNAADGIQSTGFDAAGQWVRQTSLPGMSDQQLRAIGIQWNVPDPEAINAAANYTAGSAWNNELARYQEGIAEQVRQIAIRGIVAGRNPLDIARELRDAVTVIPQHRANTLMRTLQLQSYRVGTATHQAANSDILEYAIRIAALDNRTCLCCISEHGTVVPLGTVIQDHQNGRCTTIAKVRGRPLNVQTGEAWFNAQSPERQRQIAGVGAYEALSNGRAQLRDFVQRYEDPLFGDMMRQGSIGRAMELARTATVPTPAGMMRREQGRPGNDIEGLRDWLAENEDSPLGRALLDDANDYLVPEFTINPNSNSFSLVVNPNGVRNAAKAMVRDTMDFQYGRDYLADLVAGMARENGVSVANRTEAERLINDDMATRARAIQLLSEIGKIRLTEAQNRRITEVIRGGYLDLVYNREGSEAGSLANAVQRRSGSGAVMTDAERRDRRRQFLGYVNGLDL